MQVENWMTRTVITVRPLDSIQHARELMEAQRINQLPVVVEGKLAGIVTDRDVRDAFPSVFDLTHRGRTKDNADPSRVTVETIMTPHVLNVSASMSMFEAAQIMRRERIGALPVVNADRLVGILTRSDVLHAFIALVQKDPGLAKLPLVM